MHVKIIKSSNKDFWYNDDIGKRFDISEEQLINDSNDSSLFQKEIFGRSILKSDCQILHFGSECDCKNEFKISKIEFIIRHI